MCLSGYDCGLGGGGSAVLKRGGEHPLGIAVVTGAYEVI